MSHTLPLLSSPSFSLSPLPAPPTPPPPRSPVTSLLTHSHSLQLIFVIQWKLCYSKDSLWRSDNAPSLHSQKRRGVCEVEGTWAEACVCV